MLRHILAHCFRVKPVASTVTLLLLVIEAIAATVLALVQGALIQYAPAGFDRQVAVAIMVGAVFAVMTFIGYRLIGTMERDITDAVELLLIDDLLTGRPVPPPSSTCRSRCSWTGCRWWSGAAMGLVTRPSPPWPCCPPGSPLSSR